MATIWGRYKDGEPEEIDTCDDSEVDYYIAEYKMAFGPDWEIWSPDKTVMGRKVSYYRRF